MIQCPDCGKDIADDSAHCGYCGAKIADAGGGMKTMMGFAAVTPESLQQAVEQAKAATEAKAQAALQSPPTQPDPVRDPFGDAPTEMMSSVKHAPQQPAQPQQLPPLQPLPPLKQAPPTEQEQPAPPVPTEPEQPAPPAMSLDPWAAMPDHNFSAKESGDFSSGPDFGFGDSASNFGASSDDFKMSSTEPPGFGAQDTPPSGAPATIPASAIAEKTVPELSFGAPPATSTADGPSEMGSGKVGIVPAGQTLPEKSNKKVFIIVGAVVALIAFCCFANILRVVLPIITSAF